MLHNVSKQAVKIKKRILAHNMLHCFGPTLQQLAPEIAVLLTSTFLLTTVLEGRSLDALVNERTGDVLMDLPQTAVQNSYNLVELSQVQALIARGDHALAAKVFTHLQADIGRVMHMYT
jgi:hypothetical protein